LLRSKPVDLSGRHIFLTGGTGFVGRTLLDYLEEVALVHGQRFRVTVMSRSPDQFLSRWPKRVYGITDVIHAAGNTHETVNKVLWIEQIVGGTQTALEWAVSAGASRFLLTSSGAIYGVQPPEIARMQETYLGAPQTTALSSVYGQAKRLAEQMCTIYGAAHSLETIVARCFAFTGPHVPLDGPYAVGNFIQHALKSDAIRIRGDGQSVRTYLYGRDMAHWLMTLLAFGKPGEAYNVGSDSPVTIAELAAMVASSFYPKKPVIIENSITGDGARSIYVPDIAKAGQLDLRVETPLLEAIRLSAIGALQP
jgi:nucleoside-diphosphate-sugar epimerase